MVRMRDKDPPSATWSGILMEQCGIHLLNLNEVKDSQFLFYYTKTARFLIAAILLSGYAIIPARNMGKKLKGWSAVIRYNQSNSSNGVKKKNRKSAN